MICPKATKPARRGRGGPGEAGRGCQMEAAAHTRAWRAILVLCGLILFGSAADLRAGTLLSPGPGVLVRKSAEPFGVFAFAISTGSLPQKWFALKDQLDDDLRIGGVRDARAGEAHAVAAARLDGRWLMLDNRRMAMVEDENARGYQPLFVLYQSAVLKYVGEPMQFSRLDSPHLSLVAETR